MSEARLGWLPALGITARRGFARLTPEPFATAVILGALVLVLATVRFGGDGDALRETLGLWHRGGGLWSLLGFGMQASLMLVLGSALADAPPVRRGLSWLARVSGGLRRLVGMTALLSPAMKESTISRTSFSNKAWCRSVSNC